MFEYLLGIKKSAFGLDIGKKTLKVVQAKNPKSPHLIGYAEAPVPPNSLGKAGIKEKNKVSAAIRKAMDAARPHSINAVAVVSALPESLVFTKILQLPALKTTELEKTIPYEISEVFPLSPEELYIDWQVLGQGTGGKQEVLVVGAPRHLVDDFIQMIGQAGLELAALETKPASALRAVSALGLSSYIIIDIGSEITGFTLVDRGLLELTSTTNTGGDQLAANFQGSLATLLEELANFIKYYQSRIGRVSRFQKIFLIGGGANIQGLSPAISQNSKIPTEIGRSALVVPPDKPDPKFINAIGLALREG